jgi:hypothetical protein
MLRDVAKKLGSPDLGMSWVQPHAGRAAVQPSQRAGTDAYLLRGRENWGGAGHSLAAAVTGSGLTVEVPTNGPGSKHFTIVLAGRNLVSLQPNKRCNRDSMIPRNDVELVSALVPGLLAIARNPRGVHDSTEQVCSTVGTQKSVDGLHRLPLRLPLRLVSGTRAPLPLS